MARGGAGGRGLRRGLTGPLQWENFTESDRVLAEVTLSLAQDLFRTELELADAIDLKASGLAAADVASLAIVLTFHKSVSVWLFPAGLLAAAGICFFLVLRQRLWELGTEPRKFWNENVGAEPVTILESALASTERNRSFNEPYLVSKAFWFLWGYRILALGIIALAGATLWRAYG